MTNNEIIGSSLIQSSFNFINECLKDYQKLQPEFKYKLSFGTNLDNELVEENDIFNIVLYTGAVEKIPSYYTEINGVNQLLYAGYFDMELSIVSPVSLKYSDDFRIYAEKQKQISDDFRNVDETNFDGFENVDILSDEDRNKIELGTRLLEGLSLFLTQKSKVINNFEFSIRADMPVIDGQFDFGVYRLLQSLTPMCKFVYLNDIGKAMYSGEKQRLWCSFYDKDIGDYETELHEFYNLLEYVEYHNTIKKTFPLFNEPTTKAIGNHYNRYVNVNIPELDIGACKVIKEKIYSGDLSSLEDVKFKYYDGKKYWCYYGIIDADERPSSIDKFTSRTISITVLSEITEW